MNHNKYEKGQALVMIAFAVIGLVALTGLAVDAGISYQDRQHGQNAADAAAMAAGLSIIRSEDWAQKAEDIARANNYDDDDQGVTVTTYMCDDVNATCGDVCSSDCDEFVQVIITSEVGTSFGNVVGISEVDNQVEAIAHVVTSTYSPFFHGNGLVALAPHDDSACLLNSNANLRIVGSGAWCNSDGSQAFFLNANANVDADNGYCVVGGYQENSNVNIVNGPPTTGCSQISYPPDLSAIPDPPTAPSCSGTATISGSGSSYTVSPGTFSGNVILENGATYTFQSGIYCFQGELTVRNGTNLQGSGAVVFVNSGNVKFNSNGAANFDDLEIYTENAQVTLDSNQILFADRFRMYATGYGHLRMESNTRFQTNDGFFYLAETPFHLNSNAIFKTTAPTEEPYAGLAVYMPMTNTEMFTLDSNSEMEINGTFLAPAVQMTLNSNGSNNQLDSQIIVYKYIINSNSDLTIDMSAAPQAGGASPPTIELVK